MYCLGLHGSGFQLLNNRQVWFSFGSDFSWSSGPVKTSSCTFLSLCEKLNISFSRCSRSRKARASNSGSNLKYNTVHSSTVKYPQQRTQLNKDCNYIKLIVASQNTLSPYSPGACFVIFRSHSSQIVFGEWSTGDPQMSARAAETQQSASVFRMFGDNAKKTKKHTRFQMHTASDEETNCRMPIVFSCVQQK